MDLLDALFTDLRPGEFIEVRVIDKRVPKPSPCVQYYAATIEAAREAVSAAQRDHEGWEVYFGPAPRTRQEGTKDAVSRVQVLWADLDAKGFNNDKVAALEKAKTGIILPPTAIVDSGHGYHVYWVLTEAVTVPQAEGIMKSLGKRTGGDAVQDASHVLRVPGTMNSKPGGPAVPVTAVSLRPDLRYVPSDMAAALSVPEDIRRIVTTGDARQFDGDRSRRDWAVMRPLTALSFTADALHIIFHEHPVGDKVEEVGDTYLEQTIASAQRTPPVQAEKDSPPFREQDDSYYWPQSEGRAVRVSTFTLTTTRILEEAEGDILVCDVHASGHVWHGIPIPRKAFNGVARLNDQLPVAAWQFLGTDKLTRLLLPYLLSKWRESGSSLARATRTQGRHDNLFVTETQILSATEVIDPGTAPIVYVTSRQEVPKVKYTFPSEAEYTSLLGEIAALLPFVNVPEVVWPILWWHMATPIKPVLASMGIRFPALNVYGTRGSGKTSLLLRVMHPLLGLTNPHTYDCATTQFVLLTLFASTNAIPVAFSDFRRGGMSTEKHALMLKYVLLAYDSGHDARGRADQTVRDYPLSAPFSLDGEDPLSDAALQERAVLVSLSPENIREGTEAYRAYNKLITLPLADFAGRYVQFTLSAPIQEWAKAAQELAHRVVPEGIPDRTRNNVGVLLLGKTMWETWLQQHGVARPVSEEVLVRSAEEQLHEVLIQSIEDSVSMAAGGRTPIAADEFVEDVINAVAMANAATPPPAFIYHYDSTNLVLYIHLSTAYAWWVTKRRREGASWLEKKAIKHQLKERQGGGPGQYITWIAPRHVPGSTTLHMHGLSVPAAEAAGLDVPASLQPAFTVNVTTERGGNE